MSSVSGIQAWGTYLPRYKMARETIAAQTDWFDPARARQAKGHRLVANWDEDALTMAVAAGRNAQANASRLHCEALVFASTTAPFLDRSNAGLIADALLLPDTTTCQDVGGSQRAATTAMRQALTDAAARATLILAADRRASDPGGVGEMNHGDAAAAFVVGPGEGVARFLGGCVRNSDFVHQYRTSERDADYVFEDRWVAAEGVLKSIPATVAALARDCAVDLQSITHLVVPVPRRHGIKVCAALGVSPDVLCDDLHAQIGHSGVGHALLQLAHVLEMAKPGETVCVAGFGQGCEAMLFETTAAVQEKRDGPAVADAVTSAIVLDEYLKLPVFSRRLRLDRGIRAEADKRTAMPTYFRRHSEINALQGSQCNACGTPHFPAARVCVSCSAIDQMSAYGFSHRRGRLKTFTEDWQAATPVPPLCYGNVEFDGGGNAFLELTDIASGELAIGMPLAMQFRVKDYDEQRGFRRYFWKPAPLREGGHG